MQALVPEANNALRPAGYQSSSNCGYCKGPQSKSCSYYAFSKSLAPDFYQALLDRGWRRSGTTLYKPDQISSCCPHYTIRLDSEAFRASKDQRQVVNRFNKYILGDEYIKEAARKHPLSREQAKRRQTEFDLSERIHESEEGQTLTPLGPSHALIVTLESNDFTEEKYALFANYQRVVHQEPPSRISKAGFKSFLCSSPLSPSRKTIDGQERDLGSYHQCYRIDGELVAMGVLDLLPQCVSAVYFMYHETVHNHGCGKLGALREIALAKDQGYKWWYAGFYIHSCVKMRYKGDYSPQYILDPVSYGWNLLDESMRNRLDKSKFVSLSMDEISTVNDSETKDGPDLEYAPLKSDTASNKSMEDVDVYNSLEESDDDSSSAELSIFTQPMPGILTKQELLSEGGLDHIKLSFRDQVAETSDIVGWEEMVLDDPDSLKHMIGELVAAVGTDLSRKMIVSLM